MEDLYKYILYCCLLQSLFSIHPLTGVVSISSQLSREIVEEITVTVFVEDVNALDPPQQNTTALLFITLLDVNNNPPVFQPDDMYYARWGCEKLIMLKYLDVFIHISFN